jgi:hypothetical protein
MRRPLLGSAAALLLVLVSSQASAQARLHTFYAHVTDASGAPIKDLTATDFGLIEAGKARKVSRAVFGGGAARVLLLVDSSDAISKVINPWRAGLQAFIDAAPDGDEMALVTIGRQMRIRVPPTMDRKKLKDEAGRLFSDGGGTVLLDSLTEANDRLLAKAEDRIPILVIMTTDGAEMSTATREDEFNKFMFNLIGRGALVHAVILGNGGTGTTNLIGGSSATEGLQSVIVLNLTENTGGHLESVSAATALSDKLKGLGQLIAATEDTLKGWYRIDYTTETVGPGRGLDVTVSRGDAKIELSNQPPH